MTVAALPDAHRPHAGVVRSRGSPALRLGLDAHRGPGAGGGDPLSADGGGGPLGAPHLPAARREPGGPGIVALRFDYDGTGDSAGLQDDPDRVASWLASVEAARQFLLDLGAPDVSAVGMRLGATLAGCQAAAATPFRSLVLWDPCLSGRTFLREGEALFALGEDDGRVHEDGLRHTPGFQYDAETASGMRSIDLAKLPSDRPLADRVLLLSRTDRPAPESIEKRVRLEPGDVQLGPATAQDQLLDRDAQRLLRPGGGARHGRQVAGGRQ